MEKDITSLKETGYFICKLKDGRKIDFNQKSNYVRPCFGKKFISFEQRNSEFYEILGIVATDSILMIENKEVE